MTVRNAGILAALGLLALSWSPVAGAAQQVDRAKQPVPPPAKAPRFPEIHVRKLSNGISVAVVEDHEIPAVQVRAVLSVSPLLDPVGKTGLSEITALMMNEGTSTMTSGQLAEAAADIGTPVSSVFFYTVNQNADRALALMADQLQRPAFPQTALDRIKGTRVAALRRAKSDPGYLAGRVFSSVAYGAGHPYERTATEESVNAITRDDVVAFHNDYYRPQNVSFVVGGDITADAAAAKLERAFGGWAAGGKPGVPAVPAARGLDSMRIYLYDLPGAAQTLIQISAVGPTRDTPDFFPLRLANATLGGGNFARLNANLRERHGFTYQITSALQYRRKPQSGQFMATARVATAKTDSALFEFVREVRGIGSTRPVTEGEFTFARNNQTGGLSREFETVTQKVNAVVTLLNEEMPLDYYSTIPTNLASVTLQQVRAAAARHLDASRMAIILVGDRKAIEQPVRRLGLAPVIVVNEAGKAIP